VQRVEVGNLALPSNRSGSFAMFAAIRLASSLLSSLAADSPARLVLEIAIGERQFVLIADDKTNRY
jgi:hypothetical protein